MITESDDLAHALNEAALLWPELKDERAELLRQIIQKGMAEIHKTAQTQRAHRAAAIMAISGSLDWPSNWREQQLTEWPE